MTPAKDPADGPDVGTAPESDAEPSAESAPESGAESNVESGEESNVESGAEPSAEAAHGRGGQRVHERDDRSAPEPGGQRVTRSSVSPDRIGPLLPARAAEDDPASWGDRGDDDDERLRADVPPHHGA
ncbi:hypothetical protein ABN034_14180 [Actinopolymorpha sp. B11F2]|uniref:hypothetical protein n=1 Tax=Actinopolymorpha sp. B11F2 TaxID=3160862 RepID=UPI0032E492B0